MEVKLTGAKRQKTVERIARLMAVHDDHINNNRPISAAYTMNTVNALKAWI